MIETRRTDSGSYTIKAEEFDRIQKEAYKFNLIPAMQIDIGNHKLMVLRLEDYLEFKTMLAILRERDGARERDT